MKFKFITLFCHELFQRVLSEKLSSSFLTYRTEDGDCLKGLSGGFH